MRVVSCMILLVMLVTTSTGCSVFKKNTNGGAGPSGPGMPPPKFPNMSKDPLIPAAPTLPTAPMNVPSATPASAKRGTSMLAGTVVDAYHRPVSNAYVRWVNLDDKDGGKTNDVPTDAYGHFIIQGVKQGDDYKLIARMKYNNRMFAGVTTTSAPNPRVVILVREDLVNSTTPDLPAPPAEAIKNSNDTSAKPTPDPAKGAEPNLPVTMNVPAPARNPTPPNGNPTVAPGFVENPGKERLPMLTIPVKPRPEMPQPQPPAHVPGESKLDTGPTRVPSCVLIGNRLQNLALKDSRGQTWEYKKQGQGKLVLIDFWGTHCVHCRESMPILHRMQQLYGSRGLEVIGIAMEPGVDAAREADNVNKMCSAMQVSYRQLLGRAGSFDTGKKFRPEGVALPTLYLIDEQGYIIWHYTGRPDPALLHGLERTIQARLTKAY